VTLAKKVGRVDLRSESGFTLVELMVAAVSGIIVSTATLAVVISSVLNVSTKRSAIALSFPIEIGGASCAVTSHSGTRSQARVATANPGAAMAAGRIGRAGP